MNKLFTKIAALFLGATMAVGVGVAVASNKEAIPVDAADPSVSFDITDVFSEGKYTLSSGNNVVCYTSVPLNSYFTMSTSGAANCGSFWERSSGSKTYEWRLYQNKSGDITITANSGYTIKTLKLTFANGNSGVLKKGNTTITSGTAYNVNNTSETYTVSKTGSGTNGQIKIREIDITYTVPAITHTVTVGVNNSSYGKVDKTSVTNVADNANISANGAVLTVGNTTVTATPTAQSDQYTYAFSNWSGIPAGGKVTENVTVTANFIATTRTYNVTNSVSNASFTGASTVTYGTAYSGTFTANSGYILPASLTSVTIKGTATNNYSYNSTTGEFSIAAQYVTGAIVITGACQETGGDPVGITYSLSNCTIPGKPSQMYPAQEIELTIVPDDHYKLPTKAQDKVNVTGASDWVYDDETGSIMIDGASGAVSVSVECVEKAQNTISMGTLTGVSAAGDNPTEVEEGATVTLTFTENSGYVLPTSSGVTVIGTGSSFTWTQGTGKLQITGGTGNITVSITGIARSVTSISLSSNSGSYTLGDTFTMPTVTANYNVGASEDVTASAKATGGGLENGVLTSAGTKTITISYGGQSATYTATVTAVVPSGAHISKVTSTSDLTIGSTVYIVTEQTSKELSGIHDSTYGSGVAYSTNIAGAYPLTVCAGNSTGSLAFANSSGDYLNWSGTKNTLNTNSTLSDNTSWTITISNGNATILNVATSTRRIVWNASTSGLRFATYNSPSVDDSGNSFHNVQIYKNYPAVVKSLKWITAEVKSGTYYKGNSVTASDFVVTGHYDDESSSIISSSITVTDGYLANIGTNTVTLTYNNSLSCTATVTAVQAPVTGIELDVTSASIGLDESYYLSDISVTINPSIAIQDYSWSLEDDGDLVEGADYTFDGDEYHSINPGTVVFRCTSDADTSKYADFTLTISGVPTVSITETEFSGYVGKGDVIHFVYANISDSDLGKINFVSSAPSVVDFADGPDAGSGSGTIEIEYKSQGNATISVSYNGGAVLDTVSVSVSNDSVVSVTWSATDIDVWSGATLSTTGWNVQYEMESGETGPADSYVIKLVGQSSTETITAGYVFKGSDNGKTIHVEYSNVSSTSINVIVTQRINNVYAPTWVENTWSHEIEAKTWSEVGSQTLNGISWTQGGTGDGYWGYEADRGQQFGSGSKPYNPLTLESSAFAGTISKVEVTTAGGSSVAGTVSVSVGGTSFKCGNDTSVSITSTSTKYTFTGTGSGTITISWGQTSSKALYLKALSVTYLTKGQSVQIANSEEHKAAQRAAVKFANAFNTAMSETEGCTTGLNAAWSTCSSAYNTFLSDCAALETAKTGEGEYAKNLVRYATAQYSDDSGEACIERMMRTYEICVKTHGMTPFMKDLKPLGSNSGRVGTLSMIIDNGNTVTIVVIISVISLSAIGGYFFLRKRKEKR